MNGSLDLWEGPMAEEVYMIAGWEQWADAGEVSSELPRYLAAADVVWVPSQPDRQYSHPTIPTKLLEGMTVGLAALVSDMPGRGDLVRGEGCGLAVPPTEAGHLGGVRRLLAARAELPAMGARGREAVARRYSWEAVEGDLVDFYGSLCAGLA